MGKLKKSSHQIIALVSVWICCLLLLLSFNATKAAFSAFKSGMHQAYASWNSPILANSGQSGFEIRSDSHSGDLVAGGTLQEGIRPADPWEQQIAMVLLAVGVLISISAVGFAVWRIKD
jgi:hypothetical protein